MARYIDAGALLSKIPDDLPYKASVKRALMQAQEADVVPKSEVEKLKADVEVWKQNRFNIFQRLECYEMTRQKVAREIFEEIEKIRSKEIHRCEVMRDKEIVPAERKYWEGGYNSLKQLSHWIAELKKKYTEEKKDEKN